MSDTEPHPLDDCDENECYKVMMAERTALITARQDLENSLVRTIIQMASALVVLMAGFVTQKDLVIDGAGKILFSLSLAVLVISITAGLAEHWFASKAYLSQQKMLEDYYGKKISNFSDPKENLYVARCQMISFFSFTAAIVLLSVLAIVQIGGKSDVRPKQHAASTPAASTPAASTPAASTPAGPDR